MVCCRHRISLVAGDTVFVLKDELEKLTKLLVPEQKLVFGQIELVNEKTLAGSEFVTGADNACVLTRKAVVGFDGVIRSNLPCLRPAGNS